MRVRAGGGIESARPARMFIRRSVMSGFAITPKAAPASCRSPHFFDVRPRGIRQAYSAAATGMKGQSVAVLRVMAQKV